MIASIVCSMARGKSEPIGVGLVSSWAVVCSTWRVDRSIWAVDSSIWTVDSSTWIEVVLVSSGTSISIPEAVAGVTSRSSLSRSFGVKVALE